MNIGTIETVGATFAGLFLALFMLVKLGAKLGWFENGDRSIAARTVSKLETLITLSRETVANHKNTNKKQDILIDESRKTLGVLQTMASWREVDLERHNNLKEQLRRIEAGIDELKERE